MKKFSSSCFSSGYSFPSFFCLVFPSQYALFHLVFLIWERPTSIRICSSKDEWIFVCLHFQCIVFLPIDIFLIWKRSRLEKRKSPKPYVNKLPLGAVLGTFHQWMWAVIPCQENTSRFNRLTQRMFFFSAVVFFLQVQEDSIFQKTGKNDWMKCWPKFYVSQDLVRLV